MRRAFHEAVYESCRGNASVRAMWSAFSNSLSFLFQKKENFKYDVTCKFVELYNEEFYDLLSTSQQKLTIRSDSNVGTFLCAATESLITSKWIPLRVYNLSEYRSIRCIQVST